MVGAESVQAVEIDRSKAEFQDGPGIWGVSAGQAMGWGMQTARPVQR